MTVYVTGRRRTLTYEGAMAGRIIATVSPPPLFTVRSGRSEYAVQLPWAEFFLEQVTLAFTPLDTWRYRYKVTGVVGSGFSSGTSGGVSDSGLITILTPPDVDIGGTWSSTIDVEECYEETDDYGDSGDGFPDYGGATEHDAPRTNLRTYFERPRIGGHVTLLVAVNGLATLTLTKTIATVDAQNIRIVYDCTMQARAFGSLGVTTQVTGNVFGQLLWIGYAYSHNNSSVSVTNPDGVRAITGGGGGDALITATVSPAKSYNLTGVIRAMQDPYPVGLGLQIDRYAGGGEGALLSAGSTFADSYSQRRAHVSSNIDGAAGPVYDLDEWLPVRCWIENSSLLAVGEDAANRRILFRGRVRPALTFSQAASLSRWSGSQSATGTATLTITPTQTSFQGYAFLRLTVRADSDNSAFTVQIGSKEWTKDYQGNTLECDSSGIDQTFDIDLCAPTNAAATTDTTDTKWPLPTTDGPYYGVTTAASVVLKDLASGVTYTATALTLVRHDHCKITLLPALNRWVDDGSGGGVSVRARYLLAETDGRQSAELTDFTQSGGLYTVRSAANLVTDLNGIDGWTVTDAAADPGGSPDATGAYPDGPGGVWNYQNSARPACLLAGSGAWWDGSDWQYGFDRASGVSWPLVSLHDAVEWYPGCGDVWGWSGGGYGGPLELRAAHIRRGQAWGLVTDTNGKRVANATVVMQRAAPYNTPAGSGVTDALGIYFTRLEYAIAGKTYTVLLLHSDPLLSASELFYSRKRHRVCFRRDALSTGSWISYDVSASGRHVRAYVADSTLRVGIAQTVRAETWADLDTEITGDRPCVRFDKLNRVQRIYLAYEDSGSLWVRYTLDEGRTWSTAMEISASGSFPTFVVTEDGRFCFFWGDSGAIKGVVCDRRIVDAATLADCTLIPEFTAIASDVDADAIACDEFTIGQAQWRVGLLYRSSGAIIFVSSKDHLVYEG